MCNIVVYSIQCSSKEAACLQVSGDSLSVNCCLVASSVICPGSESKPVSRLNACEINVLLMLGHPALLV